MGKGKKAIIAAQIKEEMRKLNLIGKSEIRKSFDEEAAVGLILRIGVTGNPTEELATPAELSISPVIKYRLLVGGVGIACEGKSESEEGGAVSLLMVESKTKKLRTAGESVPPSENYAGIKEYCPPDRE